MFPVTENDPKKKKKPLTPVRSDTFDPKKAATEFLDNKDTFNPEKAATEFLSPKRKPKTSTTNRDSILDAMREGTKAQESDGNINARNKRTGALSLFQVLPTNIPRWTKKHLGKRMTPQQFKNDPKAQKAVFNGEMGEYLDEALKRTGGDEDKSIRMAAAGWYGGKGAMHRYGVKKRFRKDEPSFSEYTSSVLKRTRKFMGKQFDPKKAATEFLDTSPIEDKFNPKLAATEFLDAKQLEPNVANPSTVDNLQGIEADLQQILNDPNVSAIEKAQASDSLRKIRESIGLEQQETIQDVDPVNVAPDIPSDVSTRPRIVGDAQTDTLEAETAAQTVEGITPPVATTDKDFTEWLNYKNKYEKANLSDTPEAREQFKRALGSSSAGSVSVSARVKPVTLGKNTNTSKQSVQAPDAPQATPSAPSNMREPKSQSTGFKFRVDVGGKPKNEHTQDYANRKLALEIARRNPDLSIGSVLAELKSQISTIGNETSSRDSLDKEVSATGNTNLEFVIGDSIISKAREREQATKTHIANLIAKGYEKKDIKDNLMKPNTQNDLLRYGVDGSVIDEVFSSDEFKEAREEGQSRRSQVERDVFTRFEKDTSDVPDKIKLRNARFRAQADAGMISSQSAEQSIADEAKAYKRARKEFTYLDSIPNRAFNAITDIFTGKGMQIGGDVEVFKRQSMPYLFSQSVTDTYDKHNSLSEYYKNQDRIKKKYGGKQPVLIRGLETGSNILGYVAKLPATAIKGLTILGTEFNPSNTWGIKAIDHPFYKAAQDWEKTIDGFKNKDFKDEFIVNDLAEGVGQLIVQGLLFAPTAGASVALPLLEAGVGQYEEAEKGGANRLERSLSTAIGAIAAVPDVILKTKYFRGLSSSGKKTFLQNLTDSIFGKLSKTVSEKKARLMTKNAITSFVKTASKNGALEVGQEYSEDVINETVASLTYKPNVTWQDVFIPSKERLRGYAVAGIVGTLGGAVETITAKMDTTELQKVDAVLAEQLKKGIIDQTESNEIKEAVKNELERRKNEKVDLTPEKRSIEEQAISATEKLTESLPTPKEETLETETSKVQKPSPSLDKSKDVQVKETPSEVEQETIEEAPVSVQKDTPITKAEAVKEETDVIDVTGKDATIPDVKESLTTEKDTPKPKKRVIKNPRIAKATPNIFGTATSVKTAQVEDSVSAKDAPTQKESKITKGDTVRIGKKNHRVIGVDTVHGKTMLKLKGRARRVNIENVTVSEVQTETDNDVKNLPVSERITPEDLATDVTFKKVAESVNKEKVSPKTGFTNTQAEWFVGELQKLHDAFSRAEVQEVETPEHLGDYDMSRITPEATIEIPGDGTFKFATRGGVDRIHKKLTGKFVKQFRDAGSKIEPKTSVVNKGVGVPRTEVDRLRSATKIPGKLSINSQRARDLALEQEYIELTGEEFEINNKKDRAIAEKTIKEAKGKPLKMVSDLLTDVYNPSKGEVNYENTKDVAKRVHSGTSEIERLDKDGERGRIKGGQRNVEVSLILGAEESANQKASQGRRQGMATRRKRRTKLEKVLERYAKREGIWENYNRLTKKHKYVGGGVESRVYDDGQSVIKLVDYKKINRTTMPLDFVDNRISLFNQIFPEVPYTLEGFTRDNDGIFRFIVKQPFVIGEAVSKLDVDQRMKKAGFEKSRKETYSNSLYTVFDLHSRNAVRDVSGNVLIIDAVPALTKKSQSKGRDFRIVPTAPLKMVSSGETLLAPNGKPSNLSPHLHKMVRTSKFKKWFGDWETDPENASKVVDENGEPLVVYHGTQQNFDEFGERSVSVDFPKAVYFSDSPVVAHSYAPAGSVLSVFLNIQEPSTFNASGQDFNTVYDRLASAMHSSIASKNDGMIVEKIKDDWAQQGRDEPATTYVVFKPNQIKSIFNEGEFSTDPSILKKIADTRTPEASAQQKAFRKLENKAEILPNIESKVKGDELKVSLEGAEILRVANSIVEGKDTVDLSGTFLTEKQVSDYTDALNVLANDAESQGLDATNIDNLRDNLEKASQEDGTAIINVFDESVPHERFHKVGYKSSAKYAKKLVNRIKNFKDFVDDQSSTLEKAHKTFFSKHGYDGTQNIDQIVEETATYIATGDFAKLGLSDTEASEYLLDWFNAYEQQNGVDSLKDFEKFFKDIELVQKTIEDVKNARKRQEKVGSDVKSKKQKQELTAKDTSKKDGKASKQDSEAQKLSKTPKTLRKAGIPVEDRYYTSVTNPDQKEFADNLFDKGVEKATEWFDTSIDNKDGNGGRTTAVGITLMQQAGKAGDINQLNKVANDLVPFLTDSAQSIQAVAMLSVYDPESAGAYATKVKKQATGKDITQKEHDKAVKIATEVAETTIADATMIASIKKLETRLADFKQKAKDYQKALRTSNNQKEKIKVKLDRARKDIRNVKARLKRALGDKPVRKGSVQKLKKDLSEKREGLEAKLAKIFKDANPLLKMVAWHGSPHQFDKFSTDNIGTGDGKSIQGWGLYFTSSKEVADYYKLKEGGLYKVDLKPTEDDYIQWDKAFTAQPTHIQEAFFSFSEVDTETVIEDFDENGTAFYDSGRFERALEEAIQYNGYGEEFGSDVWSELEEANPDFDWDSFQIQIGEGFEIQPEATGENAYRILSSILGGDKKASLALLEKGVRGTKAQGKTLHKGSENYVIFDDTDVEIQEVLKQVTPIGLNEETENDLRDVVALKILEGATYEEAITYLDDQSGNSLSIDEIHRIHWLANNYITGKGKKLPPKQKKAAKIRRGHSKEAMAYEKKVISTILDSATNLIEDVDKIPNKFTRNLIEEGTRLEDGEPVYSDEAAFLGLARKTTTPEEAIPLLEKEFPDLTPKDTRNVIREVDQLYQNTKKLIRQKNIQAVNESVKTQEDIESLERDKKANTLLKRRATRQANNFYASLTQSTGATVSSTLVNYRRAGLLSSWRRFLRDVASNTTTQASHELIRPISALADIAVSKKTGMRTVQGLNPKAIAKSVQTLYKQDKTLKALDRESGMRTAYNIMKYGQDPDELAKLQLSESHLADTFEGKLPELMDAYINFVFRSTSATDALFKVVAYRRSLEEQATLIAKNENKGDERKAELLKQPTMIMQMTAQDFADEMTFQNDNVISTQVKKIRNLRGLKTVLGVVAPFDRTPTNILLLTLEHTPVGYIKGLNSLRKIKNPSPKMLQTFNNKYRGAVREDVETLGDLSAKDQRKLIDDMLSDLFTAQEQRKFAKSFGRATVGSTAGVALGFMLASAGLLAGVMSPDDDDRKATGHFFDRMRKGIDNRSAYTPYGRFVITDDPFFRAMTVGATLYEQMALKEADKKDATLSAVGSISKTAQDIAFDHPLINGVLQYYRKLKKAKFGEIGGDLLATGVIPASSLVNDIGEVFDPKARTTSTYVKGEKINTFGEWANKQGRGFSNAVTRKIPGVRNYLARESPYVNQDARGGLLWRSKRMIDIFNIKPPILYNTADPLLGESEKAPPLTMEYFRKSTGARTEGVFEKLWEKADAKTKKRLTRTLKGKYRRSKSEGNASIYADIMKRHGIKYNSTGLEYSEPRGNIREQLVDRAVSGDKDVIVDARKAVRAKEINVAELRRLRRLLDGKLHITVYELERTRSPEKVLDLYDDAMETADAKRKSQLQRALRVKIAKTKSDRIKKMYREALEGN